MAKATSNRGRAASEEAPRPVRVPSVPAIHIQPLTRTQDLFLEAYRSHQITISLGAAGVGKTYLGVNAAINDLANTKVYKKLILTRSNIPTGRTLGSFPGTVEEKLAPWLAPMLSEIKNRVGTNTYDCWLRSGKIELQPLETIRGRSYDNAIILVDEAQNLTPEEIKAISTRVGANAKLVLMGDIAQRDIQNSGLIFLLETVARHNVDIPLIIFEIEDIVRSDIVADLVKAFIGDAEDVYARYRKYAWRGKTVRDTEAKA